MIMPNKSLFMMMCSS